MKKLTILAAAIFLLASCKSVTSKKADTFVYCSEGSPTIFNPQLVTDGASFNATTETIYDKLVNFERGTTNVIPELAQAWEISKDGLEYTFTLRKGVKFHTTDYFKPTREFNAEDVLFSVNRQLDKKNPYHMVNGGSYEYFNSMDMGNLIKKVEKLDDYTVKFTLSKREAPFLANLAMGFMSILSKEYADKLLAAKTPELLDTQPIGTGPFIYQKYIKDSTIRYAANPEYFKGAADIKKLVFAITPDASVRFQKLKAGECQFVSHPNPVDIDLMKQDKSIKVVEAPGLNVGYLAMNVENPKLKNKLVRQAINYALNKSSYIKAIYLGSAEVAKNPIPPTMWSYNDEVKDYDYNPEKAKELLAQSGQKNLSFELWTLPVSRPYNPNGKKMGELIQADLAKVGIKVKLVTYDWPTYLEKSKNGEHELLQLGWTGDNGDPDNFLNVLLSCSGTKAGSNRSRWCNKSFDKLIDEAKETSDKQKRIQYYMQAQEVFKEYAPWVTLAHAKTFRAMRDNVAGYKISPFGTDAFYGVKIKE
ncbi:MAG: ABC transporter substrate-binding protein [Bdellovibrionales bacterium]|nr:ABC transporter substrate-binding protein [Bdellovibrionales bacterium]